MAQRRIVQRVLFLGHVSDMPSFYQGIDVFCLASRNEGFPLSPLEAQACNTPVVLTDVGACSEAICKQTGLMVVSDNVDALAESLKLQLKRNMIHSPREFVLRGNRIEDMVNAYNKLADQGG